MSARRHHFIPQLVQRRFIDGKGRLFVLDKRRPDVGVFATTPTNAFVERDLNTIVREDGKRDVGLELWYAELEGKVAPVLAKIIGRARARKPPGLTTDERQIWDN